MLAAPFYDPAKSYLENFEHGPFGLFAGPRGMRACAEPRHEFLGQKVCTPFGIPAGPLLNGTFVKAALDMGFDIPVYKTVRTRKYPVHAWPNVLAVKVDGDLTPGGTTLVASRNYTQPLSITNSFGVPSFDPDFWQPDMASAVAYAKPGQVVVGSFQGTRSEDGSVAAYVGDFVMGARLLKETGVKIVEVNLSCPNEGTSNLLCFDASRAREIVEAIKKELGDVPLLIKIAYFEDRKRLRSLIEAVGEWIDGVCSINTISAAIVDATGAQALPGEGRLWSGVCGSSIKWAGTTMVRRLVEIREQMGLEFSIVGCGGVSNAGDYREYREAGADAVMAATAAMWNPLLAQDIKGQIDEL